MNIKRNVEKVFTNAENQIGKSLPDILTGKKQGGLGVKLAKGGFKKKTPIY